MPLNIIRSDITKRRVDAIVNAANTALQMGGGVCGAIFAAAGADKLQSACNGLAPIKTGEAVLTPGFNLPAKYVIHAAGPVWLGGVRDEEVQLRACYTNALELAVKHGCESIAFPLISSGIYHYPKAEALRVATAAIGDFISSHDIDVQLVVVDKAALAVSEELLGSVKSYIDEHYAKECQAKRRDVLQAEEEAALELDISSMPALSMAPLPRQEAAEPAAASLDDVVGNLDEPFSVTLLRLIDKAGKKDAEVYRRANIDRRLFSKIRSNESYAPSKATVLAFAVALSLTLPQTEDLLARAGFALSHSRKADVIVEYFIKNGKHDIFEINTVLFRYDQQPLGGGSV